MKLIRYCFLSFLVALALPPVPVSIAEAPVAEAENGTVIFYRPKKAKGGAMQFEISDASGMSLGALKSGSVIRKTLAPGSHTFTTRAPSVNGSDSITLTVEPSQNYYVRGEIIVGWPTWRPKFSRVSEEEGQADLVKYKLQ